MKETLCWKIRLDFQLMKRTKRKWMKGFSLLDKDNEKSINAPKPTRFRQPLSVARQRRYYKRITFSSLANNDEND
jgi:hypothetical protein